MGKKPKVICVTGGKGGTGKTFVAVNLATLFKNEGYKTLLIDGDSENPNSYLLLGGKLGKSEEVLFFKPSINEDNCTKCGICAQNCVPHALLHVKNSFPIPILAVCSGCKLCYKVCPTGAIEESYKIVGRIYELNKKKIDLLVGELKPGEARSASVVESLLERLHARINDAKYNYDVVIIDTAPGAHCDVEELIKEADYVIPVTEPTKFGLTDLVRINELITLLHKQFKVIINRSTLLGYKNQFFNELDAIHLDIIGKIPLHEEVVTSYCSGVPLMENQKNSENMSPAYKAFLQIYENVKKWIDIRSLN
jgi:MinD superfamily P-loop ATPase